MPLDGLNTPPIRLRNFKLALKNSSAIQRGPGEATVIGSHEPDRLDQ
jgi:hypothetical protein